MSSELSLFNEFNVPVETPSQSVFDRDTVIAETKRLVEEDNNLKKRQEDIEREHQEILWRRTELRFQIGVNLLTLKADHANHKNGDYITVTIPEIGISISKAYECTDVAELIMRKFENIFRDNNFRGRYFPWQTWRELGKSSTDETVVEQVIEGSIDATPKAIKEANQQVKELKDQNKELQKKFDFYKQHEQQQKELLNARIDDLEQEISETKQTPEDTPETKERLKQLEAELGERTKQRDNLAALRERLSKELDEQRDANKARHEQEMYEHRINDRVKKATEEWGKCSVTLLGQLPSPIESQVVTGGNWALIDHAVDMAQKIIDAVAQLKTTKDTAFLDSEVTSDANE